MAQLTAKEKREYNKWLEEKKAVEQLDPISDETPEQQHKRVASLLGDFEKFCNYYFERYCTAPFAWFHKKASKEIIKNDDIVAVLEFPREHAKSVFADIMLPLYLKAKGELTGMVIASANEKKAAKLLADIQAELMFNKRYIADFGEQYSVGNWQEGEFVTRDGIGFFAFGRGQSPRGIRVGEKRPNFGVVDDVDDAQIVKNEARVDEAVDWVLGDLYFAMAHKKSRFLIVGNRTHKKSILAKIVGDVEPDDPKREGIYHLKVYALENPKTHKMDLEGTPAWKENYTREDILKKMQRGGMRLGLREFFHQHIVIGRVFREEHLPWAKLFEINEYEQLITYCDPSYKDTKKNDFKAIVLVGRKERYFDIIKGFCRQCATPEMARGHYNIAELIPSNKVCKHYMEANFIQDMMLEQYYIEGDERGYYMPIRGDRRPKPEKTARIEALTAFSEKCLIRFNQLEKQNPDMIEIRNQFLGFPDASHDDGPDAVEGAISKLNKKIAKSTRPPAQSGSYSHNSKRRI